MDLLVKILYGEFQDGRQLYQLEQELSATGYEHVVSVKKGFITDLISLPWILRLVSLPTGRWARASIFHDFLYKSRLLSRKEADQFLYKIMTLDNVAEWKATGAYFIIRLFGWYRYNKYTKTQEKYRKYGNVKNIKRGYFID